MYQILLFCLIATTTAASLDNSRNAHVIRFDNEYDGVGGYNFAYETSDGTYRQEAAELNNPGSEQESLSVKGYYSFVSIDGQQYTVEYIADENGFQPRGNHISI